MIQRNVRFKIKVKRILKEISGKSFFYENKDTESLFWEFKKFRDDVSHTKSNFEIIKYQNLLKKSINYNYEKTLNLVVLFMNFYKPNYIKECDCGKDF